jgi:Flp pilus assembly protein TadD
MSTGNLSAIEQLQKGLVQHRAGNLESATSHYQQAAALEPGNPNAWHLLGVVALQRNDLALAVEHFHRCIDTAPDHAEGHNNLGVALRRMGRHQESISAFSGALKARDRYVGSGL